MILSILISFSAFSQTPEKSLHPKLDKLFPPGYTPPANTPNTTAATSIPNSDTVALKKPVNTIAVPAKPITPIATPTPVQAAPQPEVTANTTRVNSISQTDTTATKTIAAQATVTSANQPQYTSVQPVQPVAPVQSAKPKPLYRDTRLGSSSKMYSTYETNDYGAGSITTNPNK